MLSRIMGLETEYGCLVNQERPNDSPERIAYRIKETIFKKKKLGLIDLHHRAHDEPPGNGGFLLNGGRIYIDMGHLEYASPECLSLTDLVAYDRAGDRILQEAVEALGLGERVSIIKNNVDHETGATFGSHENYLVARDFPFSYDGLGQLIPFLVTRQIFTGAGRVGAHLVPDGWVALGERPLPEIDFQISQRADHIVNDFYQWVQFNRAIINTRDEPLADPNRYRRIHLLLGDSNMLEYATALKFGTTSVMLSLIEEGAVPDDLALADAVLDLRRISRDPERQWIVTLQNGKRISAVALQSLLQQKAERTLAGKDDQTDWIISEWGKTLEALATDPERLVGKIDWISKWWLLESFREAEGVDWQDPWMASLDLEYHNLNRSRGLAVALEEEGKALRRTTDDAIDLAVECPPRNTRASARGELIRSLLERQTPYVINWSSFYIEGKKPFSMEDPFKTYRTETEAHFLG
ncbi:MAG: proteasome accessory factor PafA2 family protein [Candidatus Manganitrophus sp.]|nr:proteasome accessory factor PafA2 family protein [Candidatus Manganitrophus sp.]MDC4227153.1 proteasome accessory factor PafA2 family protein [Candidatus Manganitrophus sp.]WDT71450.1 MAG: proteasome accessory factor PafA2 family protein [Candidatus Manganitrophus sp.]WDT81216.1 MAG: proteasome accessory factor PafA2 family protein [Candidatus Manganitrophus sp.]